MLALKLHLRGEFFFLQHKYATTIMMRTTRLTPIIPAINPPAIAPVDEPPLTGGPVVGGGCVWVGGWVGVWDDEAVERNVHLKHVSLYHLMTTNEGTQLTRWGRCGSRCSYTSVISVPWEKWVNCNVSFSLAIRKMLGLMSSTSVVCCYNYSYIICIFDFVSNFLEMDGHF